MHLFLLHRRLKDEDQDSRRVSQLVFDTFIEDMDRALREAAVGDQTVPKRIGKMTQVFYGRAGAYEKALQERQIVEALSVVIARNLYPDDDPAGREMPLARYMAWQVADLSRKGAGEIVRLCNIFEGPLLGEDAYVE